VAKALHVPLDRSIELLTDVPYTLSFLIRKRQQLDNLNELSKEKRPPENMIWDGTPEELDEWIDKVFDIKSSGNPNEFQIEIADIEG
jgi:hypothetical protein